MAFRVMDSPVEIVRSRTNPHFRRFRQLKDRGSDDLCFIEGRKLLEEALSAGVEILEVAITPRAEAADRENRLLAELAGRRVPLRRMEASLIASLSEAESSQGTVAIARRPVFDEQGLYQGTPLIVVAVGIQDPGNLGGLLRTAEAAGTTGAYLTEGTADPFSWKALRGSMGSAFRVPHGRGLAAAEVVSRLRRRRVAIVATSTTGGQSYVDADWRRPVAVLLGNEGAGLSETLIHQADAVISIPLRGRVESLNVGVAAGLVFFEAARQRRG